LGFGGMKDEGDGLRKLWGEGMMRRGWEGGFGTGRG